MLSCPAPAPALPGPLAPAMPCPRAPQVRKCVQGEITSPEGDKCLSCGSNTTYSFDPTNSTCDRCPDADVAVCFLPDAGDVLYPADKYWHSGPFSSQVGTPRGGGSYVTFTLFEKATLRLRFP